MIVIYDLETLKDFFLYVDLDVKKDRFNIFEISRFKNEHYELQEYLKTLQGQIGFNNLAFDSQVQQKIINKNYAYWTGWTGDQIAGEISSYSNYVIQQANNEQWPDFWERDLSIKQVDLYKVWHYNNKAKRVGLKWLQYMMDWHNIEDMPIDHRDSVDTREKADLVIEYCKNDCLSTKRFYEITRGKTEIELYKGKDKLELRKDIRKEFGFDCTNFDDVKIGDEINKSNYLKSTGISRKELKQKVPIIRPFVFEDCFPSYISFITTELNRFINSIRKVPVLLDKKQEFPFKIGNTKYLIAKGGLHSDDKPRLVIPTKNQIMRDADVGGMYPNAIRKRKLYPEHLGMAWNGIVDKLVGDRDIAKDKYKETKEPKYKSIDEAYKLAANGGLFGKLQEKTNWQFSPKTCFDVTIGSQMELVMLIERLNLGGIDVISANTDGIVSLFDKNQENLYKKICKEWEEVVGNHEKGKLDFADYAVLAQRSVNDYVAVKTNGEIKHKGGSFTIHHELHKNKSYRIIALALNEFYVKGINPRTFITNHQNIFDFCAGMRTKGDWYLDAISLKDNQMIKERLQKTNRYFISNNGVKLVKCNPDGRQIQEDAGKWKATIYNKHVEKPIEDYDINYDFYVKKTYEIISEIQPEISDENYTQLSMF